MPSRRVPRRHVRRAVSLAGQVGRADGADPRDAGRVAGPAHAVRAAGADRLPAVQPARAGPHAARAEVGGDRRRPARRSGSARTRCCPARPTWTGIRRCRSPTRRWRTCAPRSATRSTTPAATRPTCSTWPAASPATPCRGVPGRPPAARAPHRARPGAARRPDHGRGRRAAAGRPGRLHAEHDHRPGRAARRAGRGPRPGLGVRAGAGHRGRGLRGGGGGLPDPGHRRDLLLDAGRGWPRAPSCKRVTWPRPSSAHTQALAATLRREGIR